jgi:hypothetical protein
MGYPAAKPMDKANAPTPGTLKQGRINGSSSTPRKCTTPKPSKTSDKTKNGSKEGKTIRQKTFIPSIAAWSASLGNKTRENVKRLAKTAAAAIRDLERNSTRKHRPSRHCNGSKVY